ISVVFFGDGGANQGVVMEAINLAAIWTLPLILVCENNGFSEFSPTSTVTAGEIGQRARPFGVPRMEGDRNDVLAVRDVAGQAMTRARSGGGPTLIEARTYRWRGHVETEKSFLSRSYREEKEIAEWQQRDPITQLESALLSEGRASQRELDEVHAR